MPPPVARLVLAVDVLLDVAVVHDDRVERVGGFALLGQAHGEVVATAMFEHGRPGLLVVKDLVSRTTG